MRATSATAIPAVGSEPVPEGGYRVRFYPEASVGLARYDLWTSKVVRIAG